MREPGSDGNLNVYIGAYLQYFSVRFIYYYISVKVMNVKP